MKRFYISNAIPYVNAQPHVGHALEVIQSDVLARYHRTLEKTPTWFLFGTDENAVKNVQSAEKAGQDVFDFVKENAEKFRSLTKILNISNDDFIRTTEEKHIKGAQKLWKACDKAGDIYKKSYSGLYCIACEQFYTSKELENGLCPEHKTKPELVEEENYFFRLSKYQDKILELITSDELKITPSSRKQEMLSFIKDGLEDFSISRSNARAKNWGISVPGDDSPAGGQKIYVWFDALINYITGIGYADSLDSYETWWNNSESHKAHMIGKGIARFHTIYWPAMLLSAKLKLPNEVFIHGYITAEGEKMSKTLGNVVDPFEVVANYGTDAVRYFLLREIPSTGDGDFSIEKLETRYNADLANNLGNLVNRVTKLIETKLSADADKEKIDEIIKEKISKTQSEYHEAIQEFKLHEALAKLWELFTFANVYINDNAPWKETDQSKIDFVLISASHLIQEGAKLLEPFLPETAEKILSGKTDQLFPRIQ